MGVWLPQVPYIPYLPGSEIDAIPLRGKGREQRKRGVPAGGPGSTEGCARRAPAPTYLLQQRDGVPAVEQPRSEARRGERTSSVVSAMNSETEIWSGILPWEGARHKRGLGGESRSRLPGPRAGRRLMNAPARSRPGAAAIPAAARESSGGRERRRRPRSAIGTGPFKLLAAREAGRSQLPASLCSCGAMGEGMLRGRQGGGGKGRAGHGGPALPAQTL